MQDLCILLRKNLWTDAGTTGLIIPRGAEEEEGYIKRTRGLKI